MRHPHLLAETTPQSGVLLTWPHAGSDWSATLDAVTGVYLEIARVIASRELLLCICHDSQHQQQVAGLLREARVDSSKVRFALAPSNDTWVRDYGPLAVMTDAGPGLLDFVFDGWGNKFAAGLDNAVTHSLHAQGCFGSVQYESQPLVLEGGSIDTDGDGTLLTTSRCLLDSGRNPGTDKASLEQLFRDQLGIDRVLWLEHGELEGDDTDGHVDMLARFCSPDTIAYTQCDDAADVNYASLAKMEQQLAAFRDRNGAVCNLVALPQPAAIYTPSGRRLPASYVNFLVINGAVLVPAYDDPHDAVAIERLGRCFPGRNMVPVNCLPLIGQNGSLHCATMQLPEGFLVQCNG